MGSVSKLVYILCIIYLQKETIGLTCFSCLGITHPRFCKHVDTCNSGEICGLEKVVYPSGETTFNVGCFQSKTCYDNSTQSKVHETCRHCCSSDMCNDNGCGERGLTLSRGPICYHCDGALSMNECKTISVCEQNQFCFIEEQFSIGERFYTTNCQYKNVCDAVSGGMPIIGKKRSSIRSQIRSSACNMCCSGDLCNMDCWKSNLIAKTTTRTTEVTTTTKTTVTTTSKGNPRECSDINFDKQGVFTIYPRGDNHPKRVYCMVLNGIKWTVIQRRINGSTNFDKTWNEYKEGFGNVNTEYWLGNDYIHALTNNGLHMVHFILEPFNDTVRYADYSIFHIDDESTKYLLNVTGYSGNAGDCLDVDNIDGRTNGMKFSTKDQDNDRWSDNCATLDKGGWWYSACEYCNLNAEYGKSSPAWRYDLHGLVNNSLMMVTKV
uniref:Fibrinogen-related protein 10 n=1 Tax=Mytilus galloprovincialis TaxID=29158 RepID=A0A0C5PT78_MYTGA|nr:fibrinogen-related protein 10 [Mytilus galloprovincialis]